MADPPTRDSDDRVMLAWRAMLGDGNPEHIGEFAYWAAVRLGELPERPYLGRETKDLVADLIRFLELLGDVLKPEMPTQFELTLNRRKTGGRPSGITLEESRRRRDAAMLAFMHLSAGEYSRAAAIEKAWGEMKAAGRADGLSEYIIGQALDRHKAFMRGLLSPKEK